VSEVAPSATAPNYGWFNSTVSPVAVSIDSQIVDNQLVGSSKSISSGAYCLGNTKFGSKGFWHNKNGLLEISNNTNIINASTPDVVYINSLIPYASLSAYFLAGDEPFDGKNSNGSCVAASMDSKTVISAACTVGAEISLFLVDNNTSKSLSSLNQARGKLSQQLLAFVLNIRHRLDHPDAMIFLPDGSIVSGLTMMNDSINLWLSTDTAAITARASLLDTLNTTLSLTYVHYYPCSVSY
jgi:hypothetical protein